jgi:pimeloyl-ACP methyl ester carboxylesterase
MTKESLINITKSNGIYSVPAALCNTKAKTLIIVGGKELPIMKKSAVLLHDTIKGSQLNVIDKYGHGEISLIHPREYLDLLEQFFMQFI